MLINNFYREEKIGSNTDGSLSSLVEKSEIPTFRGIPPQSMERGLHERDRVGVQDFVLLENFQSESAFIDNLRKRFKEDLIYVSSAKRKNMFYIYLIITNYFLTSANFSIMINI